jgi:hypothetical protein
MEMSLEFYQSLKWASAAFFCGVCLREYAPDAVGKWLGRGGVLVSLFAMTAFGLYSARQCVTLIQLVEHKNGSQVSSVPVVAGYEIKTKAGTVVSWGGPGTMPTAAGRTRRSSHSGGLLDRPPASASHGGNDLPHAKHATSNDATASIGQGGVDF